MTAPVLEIDKISKRYATPEGEFTALDAVTLSINEGELILFRGPSGSGKSTLLAILAGFDEPSAGEARFRGRDICKFSKRDLMAFRRNHLSVIFSYFNLIPHFSALQNVARASDQILRSMQPEDALALVGLADAAHLRASQLTPEQQQRVAIARAIVKEPQIMLCDEPAGSLAPEEADGIYQLLGDLNRELGITMIVVGDNEKMKRRADRIFSLSNHTPSTPLAVPEPMEQTPVTVS
ncbi:MAG: ABC transporter ATP-binding protein [Pseudomonadota bacterium]